MVVSKLELLNFMEKIDNFQELEMKLSKLTNEKYKGDLFEQLCVAYLEVIHPQEFKSIQIFETIKDNKISNRLNLRLKSDYGIDIIAITNNDELWSIQSKFRSSNQLNWRELSTFMTSSEKADFKLVMGNINQVLHPHKKLENLATILRSDFTNLTKEDLKKIRNSLGGKEKLKPYEPRPHQINSIKKTINYFKDNDKGKLIHACGTGKTLTALWTKEKLKPKNTIVYVPSISLLKQTLEEWFRHGKDKFSIKCVCSDLSVIRGQNENDEPIVDTIDLGVPVTTDSKEISKFMNEKGDKIIFSTYQSSPVILEACKNVKGFKFDFGVFDEAHRTASKSNGLFTKCLDTPIKKKLFMTATPKIFAPHLRARAKEEDIELISMDDKEVYGEVIDEINFGKAISLGLLSDYKIKIIQISDDDIKELIDRRYWLNILDRELTADELANIQAFLISMKKINHMISFHSRVSSAKNFESNLQSTLELLRNKKMKPLDIKSFHINGTYPAFERSNILHEFIKEKKSLVTNARCLTEGVDIPAIDGVFFVDPKKNLIDIVQATGRAIRKKKDSKYGYIVIPVYIGKEKDMDVIINSSAFKPIWDIVSAMKDQDERLESVIEDLKILEGKKKFGSLKSRDLSEKRRLMKDLGNVFIESTLPIKFDFNKFLDKISVKTIEVIGMDWDERFGEYKGFKEEMKNDPNGNSMDKSERSIANWVSKQRDNYKRESRISFDRIAKLNSIGFIWDYLEDSWTNYFEKYIKFKKESHNEPYRSSKIKTDVELARWIGTQRAKYVKGNISQDRIAKLNSIGFIWDIIDFTWNKNFQDYKASKEAGDSEPNTHSENKSEGLLGDWASRQRMRYDRQDLSEYQLGQLNSINFIWDIKDALWKQKYKDYREFKENMGHEPSQGSKVKSEKILSKWAVAQRGHYKINKLSDDRIAILNLIGFEWDLMIKLWNQSFNRYGEFKNKYKNEPSSRAKNKSEREIASWVNKLRVNYKKDKIDNDKIQRLNLIGFEWDLMIKLWNQSFNRYGEFKNKYKNEPSSRAKNKSEREIGSWAHVQRRVYNKNKLSKERIDKLNSIGFVWKIRNSLREKSAERVLGER